jgi:hypothetical protein
VPKQYCHPHWCVVLRLLLASSPWLHVEGVDGLQESCNKEYNILGRAARQSEQQMRGASPRMRCRACSWLASSTVGETHARGAHSKQIFFKRYLYIYHTPRNARDCVCSSPLGRPRCSAITTSFTQLCTLVSIGMKILQQVITCKVFCKRIAVVSCFTHVRLPRTSRVRFGYDSLAPGARIVTVADSSPCCVMQLRVALLWSHCAAACMQVQAPPVHMCTLRGTYTCTLNVLLLRIADI